MSAGSFSRTAAGNRAYVVKAVKFTQDSGCLARDHFLVIFEGDHILIYIFVILLLLGTVQSAALH